MLKVIGIYLLLINLSTFICFGVDKLLSKRKAKGKTSRIPESTLLVMAAVGGSIGAIAGVYTWRHKTQHKKFTWGLPAILILQIALTILLWIRL